MRHIIFDLDGTLANSGNYQRAFEETCLRWGVSRQRARKFWPENQGLPISLQLQRICGMPVVSPKNKELVDMFWRFVGTPPFAAVDGAEDTLKRLSAEGRVLFLSTGSNQQRLNQCLDELGWADYFHLAQASSDDNLKGENHYRNMAESVDMPFDDFTLNAAIVGDGAFDMSSARDVGIQKRVGLVVNNDTKTIGLLRRNGATEIITSLGEVN